MAGEADIWQPRTLIEAQANTQSVQQRLVAGTSQQLFNLTDFTYAVGTGALEVYKNGLRLIRGTDFVEISSSSFSLTSAATLGDIILAIGFTGISGTVDVRDTDIFLSSFQSLRLYTGTEVTVYVQGKLTNGDGGEGFFQKYTGGAVGQYVDNNNNILVPAGGDGSVGWVKSNTKLISVGMFGADTTGSVSAVAAFQAAVDATPNSGYQRIRVESGNYLGDMSTLNYGGRNLVTFVEDSGTVTYTTGVTAAPKVREYSGLSSVHTTAASQAPAGWTPAGYKANLTVTPAGTSGQALALVGTVNCSDGSTQESIGIYGQVLNTAASLSPSWGGLLEAANSVAGNITYGSTYPTSPVATQAAMNSLELKIAHTGVYSELATWSVGMQAVAYGGTESTNGISIRAAGDNNAHTHSGTAQTGALGTITLNIAAEARSGYYVNRLITIVAGTGVGQDRKITAYDGVTKIATIDSQWNTIPDATSQYIIYDLYESGLWRRGVYIHSGALSDTLGEGVAIDADSRYGVIIRGATSSADFAVSRTTASPAKMNYQTGVNTLNSAICTQNFQGGNLASATAGVIYGQVQNVISNPATGAEYGEFRFNTIRNGTLTQQCVIGNGIASGSATFTGSGSVNVTNNYFHSGVQVIGSRKPGWELATGTALRTTFDAATVTLPQLAARVKALIDDLHAVAGHGLIGS